MTNAVIEMNSPEMCERAEIIREKGTNRSQFFRGQVDKYTWVDFGSSYLPSELVAAFLWAQMEESEDITKRRLDIWHKYHSALENLEECEAIRRPLVPPECQHNAHMYYLLLPGLKIRTAFINKLADIDIGTVFHYVPLHSSPMGGKVGRADGELSCTEEYSNRLVRLPLWLGVENYLPFITKSIRKILKV